MNIRLWLLRLVTWDGALPMVVWLSPLLIRIILPNNQRALEQIVVVIPVVSLILRFVAGVRFINSNNCTQTFRNIQKYALGLGLFLLLLIDIAFLFQFHFAPVGVRVVNPIARLICNAVVALYFLSMIVALYPGSAQSTMEETDPRHLT
jgi:hypothetical protein